MDTDTRIKNENILLMDLLYKLKSGELCTSECYGCCGDNELSFAYCPDVCENFKKALAALGYHKTAKKEFNVGI